MANPKPHHYVIRVSARRIDSPTSKKTIAGTLAFEASRRSATGKGRAYPVDASALVVRPGDWISFELGDVPFPAKAPVLQVSWKFPGGKRWEGAPKGAGEAVEIPAGAGYAGARFTFSAKIDLKEDVSLAVQTKSGRGATLIQLDPDVIVDEC